MYVHILNDAHQRGVSHPHPHGLCQSDVGVKLNLWCVDILEWACPYLWTSGYQLVACISHSGSLHDIYIHIYTYSIEWESGSRNI